METESNSITFRLPPELHERLVVQAKHSGITKHALARTIVVRDLEFTKEAELISNLTAIEDEVNALRQALGRGVGAILQNVTELEEQAIRDWVSERLLGSQQRPSDSLPEAHSDAESKDWRTQQ